MLRHHDVDVGVAVSIPGGLITAVVRMADTRNLSAISEDMKDLAARARSGKLNPIEYTGGTTTVSNLERFGTHEFSAIINPPHATILAVGAGERQPVVVANSGDDITVATMMAVTLSADHRGVDGALAAQLLAAFRRLVEEPVHLVA